MERGTLAGKPGVRRQGPQLADDGVCWSRRARYRRARRQPPGLARHAHGRRAQSSRGLRVSQVGLGFNLPMPKPVLVGLRGLQNEENVVAASRHLTPICRGKWRSLGEDI
jgi:hypothetical protein